MDRKSVLFQMYHHEKQPKSEKKLDTAWRHHIRAYVCVHMHTYARICVHMHAYVRIFGYVHMRAYIINYIYTHMHAYRMRACFRKVCARILFQSMHAYARICTHMHAYARICVHMHSMRAYEKNFNALILTRKKFQFYTFQKSEIRTIPRFCLRTVSWFCSGII